MSSRHWPTSVRSYCFALWPKHSSLAGISRYLARSQVACCHCVHPCCRLPLLDGSYRMEGRRPLGQPQSDSAQHRSQVTNPRKRETGQSLSPIAGGMSPIAHDLVGLRESVSATMSFETGTTAQLEELGDSERGLLDRPEE